MKTKTSLTAAALVLFASVMLTGCNNTDATPAPATPAPTQTEPAPSTPTPTETDVPDAVVSEVIAPDANGNVVYDGDVYDCGVNSPGLVVMEGSTPECALPEGSVEW